MPLSLVASRTKKVPLSGIRRVLEKAGRMEADGKRVIHFEIGRPDFDTPSHIKEAAIQAMNRGMVHYTPNMGIPALREAFAGSIEQFKGAIYDPATEIMATAGGQEAMYLSLQAFLEPGDEVLVPDPGFSQFFSCTNLVGGKAVSVPLLDERNFAPDLETAEGLVNGRTRAMIINSPHNPTGGVMTSGQIEGVCRFVREHDLLLFSDEAYDRIVYDGADFISPASLKGMRERTVIWGSLSKTYAMTGWRIGYIAGPADLVKAAMKVQQNVLLSLCSFAQAGAVAALKGPQDCVDEMVEAFDERRKVILDGISACPGMQAPTIPLGAFYVFARFDVPGMTSVELADQILEKGGVALVPGTAFGNRGEGYLRISYSASCDDCREGMERITGVMKEVLS